MTDLVSRIVERFKWQWMDEVRSTSDNSSSFAMAGSVAYLEAILRHSLYGELFARSHERYPIEFYLDEVDSLGDYKDSEFSNGYKSRLLSLIQCAPAEEILKESDRRKMLRSAKQFIHKLEGVEFDFPFRSMRVHTPIKIGLLKRIFFSKSQIAKLEEENKSDAELVYGFNFAVRSFENILHYCSAGVQMHAETLREYASELEDEHYVNLIRHKEMLAAGRDSVVQTAASTSEINSRTAAEAARVAEDLVKRQMEVQTEGYKAQKAVVDEMAASMANMQNRGTR